MRLFLRIIKLVFLVVFLTVLTQVGGLIYLLYQPVGRLVRQKVKPGFKQKVYRLGAFLLIAQLLSYSVAQLVGRSIVQWRPPLPP